MLEEITTSSVGYYMHYIYIIGHHKEAVLCTAKVSKYLYTGGKSWVNAL